MLTRQAGDERGSIEAVRRLVEVTDSSLEEKGRESAEKVQEDISTAIELAFQKANFTRDVMTDFRLGPQPAHHAIADVKRILAMVRLDTTIKVNKRTQHRFPSHSTSRLVTQALQDSVDLANGKFDIRTTKRSTEAGRDVSFMSVITFTADESQYKQFMLSMHFIQIYGIDGSNVLPPCIIGHAVIPDDAPILKAIRNGNLGEFTLLIKNGHARVWDCDSKGRSLLTYAVFGQMPEIVEYLVSQGLDVNAEELAPGERTECVISQLIVASRRYSSKQVLIPHFKILTSSGNWLRYGESGVENALKTVHVPRRSEVSDSDTDSDIDSEIDMQQDHKDAADNEFKRRAQPTSSSSEDERVYKRLRLDDQESGFTSPHTP
ncbi:hypothetical protein D6C95_08347 [Aureobasidium pullulans]|nr:hypothetical protein D6C95_08347 [Aureobasidium pullulans]